MGGGRARPPNRPGPQPQQLPSQCCQLCGPRHLPSPGVFQGCGLQGAGGEAGKAEVPAPPLGKGALGSPTTKTLSSSAVSSSASPLTAEGGQVTTAPGPQAAPAPHSRPGSLPRSGACSGQPRPPCPPQAGAHTSGLVVLEVQVQQPAHQFLEGQQDSDSLGLPRTRPTVTGSLGIRSGWEGGGICGLPQGGRASGPRR